VLSCSATQVAGWDDKFDGGGSMGFVDKAGAIMGVGFDLTGAHRQLSFLLCSHF
jgi:hypothetical protein